MKNKLINYENNCYCSWCKERIQVGEEYVIQEELYLKETIEKIYHEDCVPEEDDVYISEQND